MIDLLFAIQRVLSVVVCLLPAAVWHFAPGRTQSRGATFFGVRVEPGFAESQTGLAILRQFRWRLWLSAIAASLISCLLPEGLAVFVGSLLSSSAGLGAFALASRRTRRQAVTTGESTVRVASLAHEDDPRAAWLGIVDWLAMAAPPVIPSMTIVILAVHWHQLPAENRTRSLILALFAWILCFMCASNHWALRFRARSSDWAPTAAASHKYRTYLGVMQSATFTVIACQLCALVLMSLNRSIVALRHLNIATYFLVSFPFQTLLVIFVWRVHFWLREHMAVSNSDPMSDACWKWGYFYFNPSDPALVVPLRAGIGQSLNLARLSVWVVGAAVAALAVASLVEGARG